MARREGFGDALSPAVAPRFAQTVVTVVFIGFLVNTFTLVIQAGATPARLIPAALLLCALAWLQLRCFSNPDFDLGSRAAYLALAANALLIYLPAPFYGQAWVGMTGFLAGNALLMLRPAAGWTVLVVVAVSAGAFQTRVTGLLPDVLYAASNATAVGLIVYGLSRLRTLVRDQQQTREQLASLAVARERLRFAHDLQDLLGHSLSAITLKAELAHRFILTRTERARAELADVLVVSRQALADVRTVAGSYRELSLEDEIDSARSVLSAAEVTVEVRGSYDDLATRVRTALAKALREAVTEVLRQGNDHCTITFHRDDHLITMDVDGRQVEVPLDSADDTVEPAPRITAMAPAFARAISYALFGCLAFNSAMFVLGRHYDVARTVVAIAFVAVSLGLMLTFYNRPGARVRSWAGYAALALQVVMTVVTIAWLANPLTGLAGFVAGAALLVLPSRVRWVAFGVVVAGMVTTMASFGGHIALLSYSLVSTINIGLEVYAFTRMRALVEELHATRSELASLAVTEERLRFARDLHDLLGFSLSAITLKSELTRRLAARDPERAQQELADVLVISRQALTDIRAVAANYRALSLEEEITSARSVLEAADVDVRMRLDIGELPADVRTVLATVLREGVTNLLRHSRATRCEITFARTGEHLTLDITNDGVGERHSSYGDAGGNGIRNLTTRVETIGGMLHTRTRDRTHELRVRIPVS